jgi:stage III sporulation protein AF
MDIVRNWVINIITVIIVSFFAEILMPNGNFKKYSKLVIGLIVMVMIIKPVVQISNSELLLNKITLEISNYIDKARIAEQSKIMEEKQAQQIIKTYHANLTDQVKQRVKVMSEAYEPEVRVNVDTNLKSSGFGSIREIEISLLPDRGNKVVTAIAPVRPMKVNTRSQNINQQETSAKQTNASQQDILTKEEEQLRMKIIDGLQAVYNIPRENIKIHVKKNVQ